jgi:hypothetical protein
MIARIDHVQLAAPKGCEAAAREFYGSMLGLAEIEKPPSLRARGGCWFQCGEQQIHIGVEPDFRPAKKAHPAFAVSDLGNLRETLLALAVKSPMTTPYLARAAFLPKILGETVSNSWRRTPDLLDARRDHSYTACFHRDKFSSK